MKKLANKKRAGKISSPFQVALDAAQKKAQSSLLWTFFVLIFYAALIAADLLPPHILSVRPIEMSSLPVSLNIAHVMLILT